MADNHQVQVQINLGGITNRMQHRLQAAINVVSIGLHGRDSISPEALSLPDITTQHIFNSTQLWPVEQAKATWEKWVLRNGFRDVAEAISEALEETQVVLSHWALLQLEKERGQLYGQDWNEVIVGRREQFHRRTLPQKIDYLQKMYGFSLDDDLIQKMLSINAARNCLVHRGGSVAQQDAAEENGLVVKWQALVAVIEEDGKEMEVEPPYLVKAGGVIGIATRERSKTFDLGEPVLFTTREFSEICWTLYTLAVSCAQALEIYGKERGVEFSSPVIQQEIQGERNPLGEASSRSDKSDGKGTV